MDLDLAYPTLSDLRARAKRRIPHFAWEYLDSGTGADGAIRRSRAALDDVLLAPAVLKGRTVPDLATTLLGRSYSRPWGVSPVGMTGLFWPGAEVTLAQHCAARNLPFGLSTVAAASVEDVAPHLGDQGWFQLYPPRDPEHCEDLLKRAKDAGFHTLVLTVDVPGPSRRERQRRGGLTTPPRITPRLFLQSVLRPHWAVAVARAGTPSVRGLAKYASPHEPARHVGLAPHAAPDRDLLKRLRDMWDGPVVAKGVLVPGDAVMLRDLGVDAVWVSNHGGRQFDGAPGSAAALPLVRAAVGPDYPLIFDGAVESGLDVLRAIALGADFVMLGRPWLWGVASFGARGAAHVTHILTEDVTSGMIQMGISRPEEARGRLWDDYAGRR
ncbi:FMN-dependent alpha-hydroxy acid dehydrogenase family protein [Pseudooceanicola batsensis HTCC2597]|uniref:FMN-dependent alpha-hydroxy acid dehydrogenase family protein n=1 Tax=Pseudooceanicola batsensis (strain ATCC BAA-863 / DSM 15984 / KCTC 12145 / HTCC2597) TaxID=252305 RepID=A3TZA3_PSEBH|nr:alpha-hydroxy acid oxidase [Pseudooceanicola batsensis]EAQ02921.1 FMN-dependent alpha-hydroxy acid dehydrogenase family protein [Pseudooceanicola batsensis HTCC2597]